MKPEKPLYGKACNGCGLCCIMEQCPLSIVAFGEVERCPALVDMGPRYACGFISQPERFFPPGREVEASTLVGEMLGIGTHCDSIETRADELVAIDMGE